MMFFVGVSLARVLGPGDYGVYVFVMAIIMILSIPVIAGMPNLFVREIAKARTNNDWYNVIYISKWSVKILAIYCFVVTIVFALVCLTYSSFDYTVKWSLVPGLLIIPLLAILLTQGATLRGTGLVLSGQVPANLINPACFLILILMLTKTTGLTPQVTILLKILSLFIAILISTILVVKYFKGGFCCTNTNRKSTALNSLFSLTLIGGFQLILDNTDILLLGWLASNEEVGVYRVAVQVATLVVFGLHSINQILQPQFAKLYANKDYQGLQKLATLSSKLIFAIAIPPVLILTTGGDFLIEFCFGSSYKSGTTALAILAFGQLINASFGSVGSLLNMTGNENDTLKGMVIAVVVNMVLNILLIPHFGIEGAAFSTVISCFFWNVILRNSVRRRLGIESCGWLPRSLSTAKFYSK
jgi:O-antigen/teichoic acid export membrane protein